ncbi:MAG: MBL fold metallo-hydrolase [Proteobacteria bacterium]|nr:MBL fold metallo-hydrolase [Pseudomonadota bacterium]
MGEILDFAEAVWIGQADTYAHHPLSLPYGTDQVAESTWFHKFFSNTVIRETSEGLVMVDPSGFLGPEIKFEAVRAVTGQRLNTAIFTHGHVDHCFGVPIYAREAREKGWPPPRAIAHEAMPARFDRYRESRGYNEAINVRQFQGGAGPIHFPDDFYYPDVVYKDRLTIRVGGVTVLLHHARGETDDHTWVFFPDTRVLCTGDLIFWCVPNAGNPQKFQRYCKDWALALREMAALEPEVLLPGHGWPVMGADRVRQVLEDNAALLESIHEQTMTLMNQGASLDTVIHSVKVSEDLLAKPYLHPVYDEPEFIVRNIWRLYGGWYDGTPSHLKPAPEKVQAEEIARLAGGADKLAARALELAKAGDFRLACHLADWACLAAPGDPALARDMAGVYQDRARVETSTMAMGVFMAAARDLEAADRGPDETPTASVVLAQDERGRERQ